MKITRIAAATACLMVAFAACPGLVDNAQAKPYEGGLSALFSEHDYTEASEDSLLILAAQQGFPKMAELLLDNGADINAVDAHGYTPLIRAAQQGRANTIALLVSKGAQINATETEGATALSWAVFEHNPEVVEVLLERGANPNAGHPNAYELAQKLDDDPIMAVLNRNHRDLPAARKVTQTSPVPQGGARVETEDAHAGSQPVTSSNLPGSTLGVSSQ